MDVEFCITSDSARARAIEALRRAGFDAGNGSVRLAYRFSILVENIDDEQVGRAHMLVRGVDPCAGIIETSRHHLPAETVV